MARKLVVGFAVLALLTAFTVPAFAQGSAESSVRGNLSGTVVDSSGAVVTGAKVTISGPTGTKSDMTNQDGQFLFPLLSPGFYGVKVEKGSFKTADVKGVEVVTGKTSNVRVGMVAGATGEVVEVQGNAITVDTTSTAVAANLTDTFYQSVPVGRGVTGLFYASPGVTAGGGTGAGNPSISGGSGLENLYVADGVNITDGGFGGIGVYSRNYGSLSTGINLSFVKEVQVKTGGFEAQYGKSTGGIVQIVTKSGTNQFHGSIGGYFAPQAFEANRLHPDDFQIGSANQEFNLVGKKLHETNYDLDGEISGYVPGFKDHLFFFGSFNPQWNTKNDAFANFRNAPDCGTFCAGSTVPLSLGNVDIAQRVYSYSGKGTWKVNDNHQFEASIFGDPTYGDNSPNATLAAFNTTANDKLQFGTRNFVARYNGAMTPTWLVNGSFTWGHNNLSDKPIAPDVYQSSDLLQRFPCDSPLAPPCASPDSILAGNFNRQGLGYFENTEGNNYGFNLDTSKTFRFLGEHNVAVGYSYARSHYDGTKARTGAFFTPPTTDYQGNDVTADPTFYTGDPALLADLLASQSNAAFQLRASASSCIENVAAHGAEMYVPGLSQCADGGVGVLLRQVRGEYGNPAFKTQGDYHTLYSQDTWSINKYLTITAGLRWEQQKVAGVNSSYTFTDNWSPRVGFSIDPWGNRKTKIFANFGRYSEALPLDIAIRSLSNEKDMATLTWIPQTDGAGHVVVNTDGTVNPVLDSAHLIGSLGGISAQSLVAFGPGTRSEYLDEYVVGFEHEFGNSGVIFSARYQDRRIKRIVEDMAALSPEAYQNGLSQNYLIANPGKNTDIFVNPHQLDYTGAAPAGCTVPNFFTFPGSQATDANGNTAVNAAGNDTFCITNGINLGADGLLGTADDVQVAGSTGSDGIPDGFANPVRIYKSMEFEVNKSFSKNWQLRANYRIAKLFGNYEGSFRNDNGQSDPNISSLFDFTQGDFNLLGQQFVPGVLNTDVRHTVNGYASYTFGNHYMKGLTIGTGAQFHTGTPISNLFAHPAYQNAGEMPFCADNTANCASARGSLGRTQNWGQVDAHADYPIRLTERTKIRLAADLFNLTNMRTQLRVNQLAQSSFGVPNPDFLKPQGDGVSINPGYQRPFYARFGVRFEF
ncbi:MAG: carboxypeptidase regulatory-like domain-containing protein [Terriglobales bacterium]